MVKRLRERAFWVLLIMAWLAIGVLMTVRASYIFAAVGYVIAFFYIVMEVWLWRRITRAQKAVDESKKQNNSA
ncbi:MAG: hypothetical protein NTZ04_00490 [Chloroflexi bacterium]|nr:hypothetical protein [Chloroflexota bacterium]